MKRLLAFMAVGALVAGCAHQGAETGGAYYVGGGNTYGAATGGTGEAEFGGPVTNAQGPGMHSDTPTGTVGPGVPGIANWQGGTIP